MQLRSMKWQVEALRGSQRDNRKGRSQPCVEMTVQSQSIARGSPRMTSGDPGNGPDAGVCVVPPVPIGT